MNHCTLHSTDTQDWWVGQWQIHTQKVEPHSIMNTFAQSLNASFFLKVNAQQAVLTIDQDSERLATHPIGDDQGVKLVGKRDAYTIWCTEDGVWWSQANSLPIPIKRVTHSL